MSDAPSLSTAATAAAILLAASLIAAAATPGMVAGDAVAGGFAAGDSGSVDSGSTGSVAIDSAAAGSVAVDSVGPEAAATDRTAVTSDPSPDSDAITPDLRASNGTVEVVVRFAGDASPGADSGGGVGSSERSPTLSADDLKTNAASAQADFESFADRKPGVTVERSFWLANAMLVTVDTESAAVDRLLDVRGVERVHENFEVKLDSATMTPDDGGAQTVGAASSHPAVGPGTVSTTATGTNATYGVEMVRAPEVWEEFGTRGEGATVAVLDTGIETDHPDLNVSGWAEYDAEGNLVSDDVADASDVNGHGTHVAGTVAGGNASGTAIGVAPEASLYGVKVLNATGSGTFTQVVAGMEHATETERVDVLQMSLGDDGQFDGFIEPIQNARSAGKIVVASSGNSGDGTSSSPGNVYESFAVGAVNETRDAAWFSGGETLNTSEDWNNDTLTADWPAEYVVPDSTAPGANVYSAEPGGGYTTKSGTSMAAPHVSGVAALVLASTSRNVSDEELSDILRDTANHPDNATEPDARYGTGIADAYAAVSSTEPLYDVSGLDSPPIAERNGTIDATVTVTNVGRISGENRTVELRLTDPANTSDVRELTATNVSLGVDDSGTVRLNGTVPADFGTGETTIEVASPDDNATAAVRIADAVGAVNGTVTDAETNATLPAVDVVVRNGSETVGVAATDENGTYDVDVPATDLTVTASNATYASANQTVELNGSGDTATANLSLALRNGTLAGVVNAGDDMGPPANATVAVTNGTNATVATVETVENGSYAVDLRPGSYGVTAEAPDFHSAARTDVTIEPNATTDSGLALDPKAATLSGTVTNDSDDDPVADATVTAGSASRRTDATGNYSLAVDRGERRMTVSAAGYAESSTTLDLSANESREANVSLTPTAVFEVASISGPDEIETGTSGEFSVGVRNEGRATGNVTASAAVSPSGTVDPASRSFSDVEVGATRTMTTTVSIGDGASTGTHDLTASAGDDTRTEPFDVVDSDESTGGGGGDGGSGGSGGDGGGGGGSTSSTDGEETTDTTNESDGPVNETLNRPTRRLNRPTRRLNRPTRRLNRPTTPRVRPPRESPSTTNRRPTTMRSGRTRATTRPKPTATTETKTPERGRQATTPRTTRRPGSGR